MVTEMNPESGGTARPDRSTSGENVSAGADAGEYQGSRNYQAPAPDTLRLAYMPRRERAFEERAGDALGWLSVGLGLAALLAPRAVGRSIGMPNHASILRAVGVRELVSGAGLLTQKDRTPWLWSRVVGDAMDLALLGTAARPSNPGRGRALGALAVVSSIAAMDLAASIHHTRRRREGGEPLTGGHEAFVEQAMIIAKSPQECYAYWRDLANLPRFMRMLHSITVKDDRHSHWVIRTPAGAKLEWDSEITVDQPGERIAWHSMEGSSVTHAGSVRFEPAPGGRGCIVRVLMHYRPPMGRASLGIAKLLGRDAVAEVREDLRRFKQVLETGEIPTTEGQPSGRRSWFGRLTPDGRKSREGRILEERAS
jgi:uncharacterized membrane protein